MSVLRHDPIDIRICAFCKQSDWTYRDGAYELFHYSVRRYAHAACLLKAKGLSGLAMLPLHLLKQFPALEADSHGLLDKLRDLIAAKEERCKRIGQRIRSTA